MAKLFLIIATLYGLLGVVLGAFGAHALRAQLSPDLLRTWQTGVEYQFYHAFALLAVGLLASTGIAANSWTTAAGGLFVLGVLLFSGSLYGLALGGPRLLGPVTPFDGLLLIAAWGCLLVAMLRIP